MRSQISCASPTGIFSGTTMWKSTKITGPAWRVLRSCTPSEPLALAAIACLIASSSSAGTARSISPSIEREITIQPWNRMLQATMTASKGSRIA
ncbi:hypothetical protein D3C72_2019370 [compost metagenome]